MTLCRRSDTDRASKFDRVLERLKATGGMADLDDGPEQTPLSGSDVQGAVLGLLRERRYDVILTHSPFGEYTRHRRHEEVGDAVSLLWRAGTLHADELWLFAYDDAERRHLPRAIERAHLRMDLDEDTWERKREIIESIYGFAHDSWEARVTPRREAFWCFRAATDFLSWLSDEGARR